MNQKVRRMLFVGVALAGWAVALSLATVRAETEPVFEMRTYYPAEGKNDAMHARFRDHTDTLFRKHGMVPVGYWVPIDTEKDGEVLIYVLQHESREAAARSWQAFREDPDWIAAKAASEVDGTLVEKVESVYLRATDYSGRK